MANHVYFNLSVEGLTDEQWDTLFKSEEHERPHWNEGEPAIKYQELVDIHEQPFMSNIAREYEEDGYIKESYQWYCDNVGAKWCHIEEWENHGYMNGYSAWSTPYAMVINMLEFASNKFNIELSAKMTYEDEFRNFIGVDHFETYKDDEYYCAHDEDYIDGNDLNAVLEDGLGCDCSEDDFEWDEPYKDTDLVPIEVLDEIVYNFWETGELRYIDGTV